MATTLQDIVEAAIAKGMDRESIAGIRGELAELRTGHAFALKAADLVNEGNLMIPNREPGREAACKFWDGLREWRGWKISEGRAKS